MVMSGRSVNLTTLFMGRLRPPKRLTSTSCTLTSTSYTYFRQLLTTVLLEKAEGETKVCCEKESGALPIALHGPAEVLVLDVIGWTLIVQFKDVGLLNSHK